MNISFVRHKNLEKQRREAERESVRSEGPSEDQLRRGAHRGYVCAEIENVGDAEQEDNSVEQRLRIISADVVGDALAGDTSETRADFLDRGHQRKRKQHGPEHAH